MKVSLLYLAVRKERSDCIHSCLLILKKAIVFPFTVSPNIIHGPQNVTVKETENRNVTLYCNATGRPAARLSWVRVKDEKTVASGNTLLITAAGRSDLGEYRCIAENGVGNPATKSAYVDVHCKFILFFFIFSKRI